MKTIQKLITIIQEDIIGTDNRVMAIAWLVCLSGLLGLGVYLSSESRSFLGVADSREQQIAFEYPVSIKRINVIAGQTFRKGDLLMELDQNELGEKIRLIRSALAKIQSERSVRQQLNLIVSNTTGGDLNDPMTVEIDDLSEQVEALEQIRKNLYIFASFDGIVGTVNFRRGEKVPAFNAIMTLAPDSPTYVEGFVHESLRTKLEVGKKVSISSVASGMKSMEGKIVSVGSRIILIPTRLMAYPNMQVYGREVVVEIPEHNGLLLGEKVHIKPKMDLISFPTATAATKEDTEKSGVSQEPQEIKFPSSLAKRFDFEPSGLTYLEDLKKFLIVSDDTDKEKSGTLFLMNSDGTVEEQVLTIPGIGKISDLESISQDGGYIYLMTSQGLNKKGKNKQTRNQFLRVKRTGLTLYAPEAVDFKTMLVKAIQGNSDAKLKLMFKKDILDFEIESHFIDGKRLYVGLKKPLNSDDQSVLLTIENFESIFSEGSLKPEQLKLGQGMAFEKVEGAPHRLSDIMNVQGQLYATSVCHNANCGAIWKLNSQDGKMTPSLVKFFGSEKPEGLAFDTHKKALMITFDQKQETAKFGRIALNDIGKTPLASPGATETKATAIK